MKNEMIKRMQKKEGGFTLVELIVVLVILAILAAILVPTLLGYIDKARDEKNYSTAQTVRVAAQSVADSLYANNATTYTNTNISKGANDKTLQGASKSVLDLAGQNESTITAFNFTVTNGQIVSGAVTINDGGSKTYTLSGNDWTVS